MFKNVIFAKCSNCGTRSEIVKKELWGVLLILCFFPLIYLFGVDGVIVYFALIYVGAGLYWIITRPSTKFICKTCAEKKQNSKEPEK